ncbi:T9SS type A sorting domain-containing protein [Salinimicrobium oceani]|uniref:T9SS type A sorting domain-containing protein n=1 Tax=Salinimicrobium oceani TaxID=2722702 RepID=A0ABX1D047_9FLAO|nr:T9SS type A sorting domain-containing protein [Salinimicrobium oceani]NJW53892.1 T9SS type A sorting domain-containing protein [Salinimicrobium oceani]
MGATLEIDECFTCEIGDPGTPLPLVLTIYNKTGSFRPTFAFFGTLEVTDAEGDVTTSQISGCDDQEGIQPMSAAELTFQDILYVCGSTYKLTNVFLAWTDASKPEDNKGNYDPTHPNSCPILTTKPNSKGVLNITPKCGTDDEIIIDTPINVIIDEPFIICEGETVTLTANATGGDGAYSYEWSPGGATGPSIEVSPTETTDYTVTVSAPSIFNPNIRCHDSYTATVTVNPPNDAGDDGELTVCSDDVTVYNLFDELTGLPQTEGSWTDPAGDPFDGSFNASEDGEGTYTYTVDADGADGPCAADSAEVEVTISPANNAGIDGELTVCSDDVTDYSLFDELTGNPQTGGSWTDPAGDPFDGTFNASEDGEGTYTYTVDADGADGPCAADSAEVEVTISPANNAGIDGELTVCSDDVTDYSLFDELTGNPQTGGSWTDPAGDPFDGTFNASEDGEGTYTYTVDADGAEGPCLADSADVEVSINTANYAGVDGDLAVCSNDTSDYNLFSELTGSPQTGGTWTAPGGGEFDGSFNASSDSEGTYTYTVDSDGEGPCLADSADVEVTINTANYAGVDGDLAVCSNDTSDYNLFSELTGSPQTGGSWRAPGGGEFDGSFNASSDAEGTYTYTVDADGADGPCAADSAEVEVTISPSNNAGIDGELTVCSDDVTDYSLFDELTGNPQTGGSWTDPAGDPFDGTFNASEDGEGTYTYTVDADGAEGPCLADSADVEVSINTANYAGVDGDLAVCSNDTSDYNLFSELTGSPQTGGTWTAPGGGEFDGSFNASSDSEGTYTYTVDSDDEGPCLADSADVEVTINTANYAGVDGDLAVCSNDTSDYNLFSELTGSPQTGGKWTAPGGREFDGSFNASSDAEGTYTYTVDSDGEGPCLADSADVEVSINTANYAGVDGDLAVCSNDTSDYNLFSELTGSPQTGGSWTAPGGGEFDGSFNASSDAEGTYTYTVDSDGEGPCLADSANVVVTVENCIVDQGCTPGYWKNHLDAWAAAGVDPMADFFVFFDITNKRGLDAYDPNGGNFTLLDAISSEVKTSDNNGWFAELARHAVAAYLNAAHPGVGYAMSPSAIKELTADTFNYNYGNGKKGTTAANNEAKRVATILKGYNELYCPLGNEIQLASASVISTDSISEPVEVQLVEAIVENDVALYPNPFRDVIHVKYDINYTSDVVIEIFNLSGNLLRTISDRGVSSGSVTSINVDFSIGTNQMYIVRVSTDRETFVKQTVSSKR